MNKNFKLLAGLCAATLFVLPSCGEKPDDPVNPVDDPTKDVVVPNVTISADSAFDEDGSATLTLTLDQATTVDVVVKLANVDVADAEESVYASFKKEVTIPAGKTSATVYVEVDPDGCTSGHYQVGIKIAGAEKATVASADTVYISFDYVAVSYVSLYSDPVFSEEGELKLKLSLDVAAATDVTVKIAVAEDSPIQVNLSESTVVIPAGECEAFVDAVAVSPDSFGEYVVNIAIVGVENAEIGLYSSTSATYDNRAFKFNIDGKFNDWVRNPTTEISKTDDMEYQVLKTVKYFVDETDLYVYMEIEGATKFGNKPDFNVIMDFYIDCDGISNNGYKRDKIFNHTCNWYYETFVADISGFGKWDNGQYYSEAGWGSWMDHDLLPADVAGFYDVDNDFAQVEARLGRKDFKITGTKVGLGMTILDGAEGWVMMGKLPQNDDLSLLVLDIPAFKE